jgi:uncharacterized protein (TIGR00661 family)
MAKIIYGVAGEGFGHSSRAQMIGKRLIDAGHNVIFAASHKSLSYLRQYFGDAVHEVFGLTFHYKNGIVHPFETVKYNLAKAPEAIKLNHELFKNRFEPFAPDLVITDFEPFCAWWAWKNGIEFISIDNEHALTHLDLEKVPKNVLNRLNATVVTRAYFVGAARYVIMNFFKAPVKSERAVVMPPIVRPEVLARKPAAGEQIVVYTTTGQNESQLLDVLRQFPSRRFHIYGMNKDQTTDNCIFKKTSTEGFLDDLACCGGVVASAGFSLLSECMVFRKKMLLVPVPGQYEQILNAWYVQKLGLGVNAEMLTNDAMQQFLDCLEKPMPSDGQIIRPDNEKFFADLKVVLKSLKTPVEMV